MKTLAKMKYDLETHDKVKTHKRTFFKLLSQLLYRPSSPIVLRNVVLVFWLVDGGGGGGGGGELKEVSMSMISLDRVSWKNLVVGDFKYCSRVEVESGE